MKSKTQSQLKGIVLVLSSIIMYGWFFHPLYPLMGILTPLIGFIIVAFWGWLFGIGMGVFAGTLFGLLESYFLYQLELITIYVGALGVFFELGVGGASGWVGTLQYRTKEQEKRLEKGV